MVMPTIAEFWSLIAGTSVLGFSFVMLYKNYPPHWLMVVVFIFASPFFAFGTGSKIKIDAWGAGIDIAALEKKINSSVLTAFNKEVSPKMDSLVARIAGKKGNNGSANNGSMNVVTKAVPLYPPYGGQRFFAVGPKYDGNIRAGLEKIAKRKFSDKEWKDFVAFQKEHMKKGSDVFKSLMKGTK